MINARGKGQVKPFLIFASVALLAVMIASACQSSSGTGSGNTADLKLSFNVLGASASAASGSSASKSISRLVLSSASTLTVSLTPLDSGLATPAPQTVSITSGQVVSVSFSDVEYGNYTIKAVASDSSGVAQFQQAATVTVTDSTPAVSLTLLPANPESIDISAGHGSSGSSAIAVGESHSYAIPASALSGGQYFFYVGVSASSNFKVYVQDADGSLILTGDVGTTGNVTTSTGGPFSDVYVTPPSSSVSYVTFMNSTPSSFNMSLYINFAP